MLTDAAYYSLLAFARGEATLLLFTPLLSLCFLLLTNPPLSPPAGVRAQRRAMPLAAAFHMPTRVLPRPAQARNIGRSKKVCQMFLAGKGKARL